MMPPATVAVGYCINFDKEKEMASHISLIGTLCAIVGIIVWLIVLTVIGSTGFFA
jgi:predicted permease